MLGLPAPSCALPCPQGTAKAVQKPQAKSSLFLSRHGTGAHRQDWERWGSQPPRLGRAGLSLLPSLRLSRALLSSAPPLGPAQPLPHGPPALGVLQQGRGCSGLFPRAGMSLCPGATAALQSRCLEEPQRLCPEPRGL